jgi:hypothetical protein
MKELVQENHDISIDEYPGYLGLIWDGFFSPGQWLTAIEAFDPVSSIDQDKLPLKLSIKTKSGRSFTIEILHDPLVDLIRSLPAVTSYTDRGPEDQVSPGSGFVFFLRHGSTYEGLAEEIEACLNALRQQGVIHPH